jgi:hypothetical protein
MSTESAGAAAAECFVAAKTTKHSDTQAKPLFAFRGEFLKR